MGFDSWRFFNGVKMDMKSKAKYPVNQLQLGHTDTRGAVTAGYGAGNMDPHQAGYMGETVTNTDKRKQKKRPIKAPFYTRFGNGNFPNYPES